MKFTKLIKRPLPNGLKRFLYAWGFYAATYLLLGWLTDVFWLSIVAAGISYVIAAQDWDWRQRRKAQKAVSDV